jgi:hypothetical protein
LGKALSADAYVLHVRAADVSLGGHYYIERRSQAYVMTQVAARRLQNHGVTATPMLRSADRNKIAGTILATADDARPVSARADRADRGHGTAVATPARDWMDRSGEGERDAALGSAMLDGSTVRFFAGCGIVGDSDPEAELAEAQAQFVPVRDALGAS